MGHVIIKVNKPKEQVIFIKKLFAKGFSPSTVWEILNDRYPNHKFSKLSVTGIASLSSYNYVAQELNEKIASHIVKKMTPEAIERIKGIKEAYVAGYTQPELKELFDLTNSEWKQLKINQRHFYFIASELNDQIYKPTVTTYYDKKLVTGIKKYFIQHHKHCTYPDIGMKFGCDKTAVCYILNLQWYPNWGTTYNKQIKDIMLQRNKIVVDKREKKERINKKKYAVKAHITDLVKKKMELEKMILEERSKLSKIA